MLWLIVTFFLLYIIAGANAIIPGTDPNASALAQAYMGQLERWSIVS